MVQTTEEAIALAVVGFIGGMKRAFYVAEVGSTASADSTKEARQRRALEVPHSSAAAKGMPLFVGADMVLAARFAAIARVGSGTAPFLAGTSDESTTKRPSASRPACFSSLRKELQQSLPDPLALPVAQSTPAGHSRAAAQLQRQCIPRDACLEGRTRFL